MSGQMPFSIEAEQAVLGSLLIDPRCIPAVVELLSADDFFIESHRVVFETICHMFTEGRPVDPVTVIDEMKLLGYKDQANRDFFLQLIETTPSSVNVERYADIVRGKSLLRQLQSATEEISEIIKQEQDDPQRVADLAEQKIYSVRHGREIKGLTTLKSAIQDVFTHLDTLVANPGKLPGLPTGFSGLDRLIGGFNNSDLIILASRPGMGKTSMALNMARAAAKATDKSIVIFQLEMSSEQLASRFLSSDAQVDSYKLRMGNLNDSDWIKITDSSKALSSANILIDDNSMITVPEMKAKCRRLGDKIGMVIIDYLQLMHSPKNNENRVQEVAEISRSLKIMAKELNVPVLCCSQLSRGTESRTDKKPQLSDLRESGAIEQDADIVLFIYREEYYNRDTPNKNTAELIIAKNRHGELDSVPLQWMGQYTAFYSRDDIHDEDE